MGHSRHIKQASFDSLEGTHLTRNDTQPLMSTRPPQQKTSEKRSASTRRTTSKPKAGRSWQPPPPYTQDTGPEEPISWSAAPPPPPHVKLFQEVYAHIGELLSQTSIEQGKSGIDENKRQYHSKAALARMRELAFIHPSEEARKGWKQLADKFEWSEYDLLTLKAFKFDSDNASVSPVENHTEERNILADVGMGLGIIVGAPVALVAGTAVAVVGAAGVILHGAGKVLNGLGYALTFGNLK